MADVLAAGFAGYVTAGYVIAGLGLAGYFAHLLYRARRARSRVAAAAARRDG